VSYVNPRILRGVGDALLSTVTNTIGFTTTQIINDTLTQFGSYMRAFRIVNNDAIAQLTYRQGAADAPLKIVPASAEVFVEGWESFIEINPSGVSGTGFIEMDLVDRFEALKNNPGDKLNGR